MDGSRRIVTFGLLAALATGCSRSAPAPGPTAPGAATAADKGPKFESELVYAYVINGAKLGGVGRSFHHDGGKPFAVAGERWKGTQSAGNITLSSEVAFVGHRDGKDFYKTTYTVTEAGTTVTKTSEASYDGKRTILVEDNHGFLALQPPTQ